MSRKTHSSKSSTVQKFKTDLRMIPDIFGRLCTASIQYIDLSNSSVY